MATPEGTIQSHLKRRVEQCGGEFRKLAWVGRRGAPDCVIWWNAASMTFVEVKTPKGVLSTLQAREIVRLREAGFRVEVVRSTERVDALISELYCQSRIDKG